MVLVRVRLGASPFSSDARLARPAKGAVPAKFGFVFGLIWVWYYPHVAHAESGISLAAKDGATRLTAW